MRYKIAVYQIYEFGKRVDSDGNPHQEDSMYPAFGQVKPTDRLFVLCDGMGGHDAGEVASATVCEAMSDYINKVAPESADPFTTSMLDGAIQYAFDELDAKDTGTSVKKMGTTMTMLKLHEAGATIAHMGDSRVYQIRPGATAADTKIVFRTDDHSLVNDLVRIGELTPEEAKHSRQKNVITRAMQPHMESRPKADVHTTADIRPGDYFYMCTDGMLENMEDEQICYNFSDVAGADAKKVHTLTLATRENRDNHSAIIVHVLDVMDDEANATAEEAKSRPLANAAPAEGAKSRPLANAAPAEEARPVQSPTHRPKDNKRASLIKFLITLLLVAVAGGTIIFLSWSDSGDGKEADAQAATQPAKPAAVEHVATQAAQPAAQAASQPASQADSQPPAQPVPDIEAKIEAAEAENAPAAPSPEVAADMINKVEGAEAQKPDSVKTNSMSTAASLAGNKLKQQEQESKTEQNAL